MRKSTRVSSSVPVYLSEPLSNNLRVARQTKCRSILLSTTANFLSRNFLTTYRSPLRIGQSRRRLPELRRYARHCHALGSFGPRHKRCCRQSVPPRAPNRSHRAACRLPHSTFRHRATRRPEARHSSGCKLIAAQVSVLLTGAIERSSVRSFLLC